MVSFPLPPPRFLFEPLAIFVAVLALALLLLLAALLLEPDLHLQRTVQLLLVLSSPVGLGGKSGNYFLHRSAWGQS